MDNKIKGLELSKLYFENVYLPELKKEFPQLLDRVAAGLAGEGSECFGYDDEISRDHDFGPSCCIWLTSEDYREYGKMISDRLNKLPKEFMGFQKLNISEWGNGRRGILDMGEWYYKFLGMETAPTRLYDWRIIPETALASAINGEIFIDNLGEFSKIRNELKKYFPEDIRLNKIATRCMKIAQSGQYNFGRCMKRGEYVAARVAEAEFIDETVHMIYLLNREYKLFYKWMHRKMKELSVLGEKIYYLLKEFCELSLNETDKKINIIENICENIIFELENQGIINNANVSDFLLDYGPEIQEKIKDEKLRKWSPWLD
ncbi:DUF4037 domain-containing protein [Leptotrichia sp. OH3620_COT-345]|uniref:DUF4037 domain-containing protein n=1 Tax=Leptotrichia sp. OH3620_COT-345 TaxID=2491048 RepID=UPI000F64837F|nr:DUF4037 domain-containing protein [Leptotrichia sp. OH3620_COT-345]RRD39169.1 DUF4037 domain-containing protein [Leptotrichia sp. OH3620_COT-345]